MRARKQQIAKLSSEEFDSDRVLTPPVARASKTRAIFRPPHTRGYSVLDGRHRDFGPRVEEYQVAKRLR